MQEGEGEVTKEMLQGGRFGARGLSRGGNQDGGDYNRARGNGFYQGAFR